MAQKFLISSPGYRVEDRAMTPDFEKSTPRGRGRSIKRGSTLFPARGSARKNSSVLRGLTTG